MLALQRRVADGEAERGSGGKRNTSNVATISNKEPGASCWVGADSRAHVWSGEGERGWRVGPTQILKFKFKGSFSSQLDSLQTLPSNAPKI